MDEMISNSAENQSQIVQYGVDNGWFGDTSNYTVASEANQILNQLYGIRNYNNEWSAYQAWLQRMWSADEAEKSRAFNSVEAAKNREWQQYMSDTAHRRELADLKAAGLNPVLSALGGQGASVGSGATASSAVPSGQKGDTDESLNMALASILGTLLTNQERMQETLINAQLTREEGEAYREVNKLIAQLGYSAGIQEAGISAAAAMHGQDLTYDYNMKYLNWNERNEMAWRIIEKSKVDISKMDTESQIKYRANLLMQAGYDRANAYAIAKLYTDTSKSEGAGNRGMSFINNLVSTLAGVYGNTIKAASGN